MQVRTEYMVKAVHVHKYNVCIKKNTHTHTLGIYKSVVFALEAVPPLLQQSACVGACIQWYPSTTSALMWLHSCALIKRYFFNIYIYIFNCRPEIF